MRKLAKYLLQKSKIPHSQDSQGRSVKNQRVVEMIKAECGNSIMSYLMGPSILARWFHLLTMKNRVIKIRLSLFNMEKALKSGQMGRSMAEIGSKAKQMVKAGLYAQIKVFTKEDSKMIWLMVSVFIHKTTDKILKAIGSVICSMAEARKP